MGLVDQWRAISGGLPQGWEEARLRVTVADPAKAPRAAALLGPANPGRAGSLISLTVARRGGGGGPSPDLVRRLLARLDTERINGLLDLARIAAPEAAATPSGGALAGQWEQLEAGLPEDWSDVYAEVELRSTDYLEPAALLLAPVNPSRVPDRTAFRFRVARRFGYGASPEMTHRCFERLDAESIRGAVQVLWALSDTKPVYTQGPVWYVGGRAV